MESVLRVFVGWDARENTAYEVCKFSIERRATRPVIVEPLRMNALRYVGLFDRNFIEREGVKYDDRDGKPFSTDFAFTRFLVPALARYEGWAVFCDCDFLWRADIADLFALADDRYAVMCVKHDHRPREADKMDGQKQQRYFRKNWSSLILWNCGHPANLNLTVDAVNTEPGRWLHGFGWLKDEEIGGLDEAWNWLEGWSDPNIKPYAIHFTRGGPWFPDYQNVRYADEWKAEQARMTPPLPSKRALIA